MSRNDTRPKSPFSLRYLATQELEVSLRSATAVAMLGSVLSKVMVVLTLLITSSVSFTYSSSEAANAGERAGVRNRATADRERKLRRHATAGVARLAVVEVLDRGGARGFAVVVAAAAVGVIREAMGSDGAVWRERRVIMVREDVIWVWLIATWAYRLIS